LSIFHFLKKILKKNKILQGFIYMIRLLRSLIVVAFITQNRNISIPYSVTHTPSIKPTYYYELQLKTPKQIKI